MCCEQSLEESCVGLTCLRVVKFSSTMLDQPEKQDSRIQGKVQVWAEAFEPQTQEFVNLHHQLSRDLLRVWGREYRNCQKIKPCV